MFQRKTLFVIGAGASYEVGIPVGIKLAKMISETLSITRDDSADSPGQRILASIYDKWPAGRNVYQQAAGAISRGVRLANSIDDYLDQHSTDEPIQRVGKAAIVRAILNTEQSSDFKYDFANARNTLIDIDNIENTWFVKFFRMLATGVNVVSVKSILNNVAFIVFNYDRCLEFFLVQALQLSYGIGANDALEIVSRCSILHPYGVVAPLFPLDNGLPFGGQGLYEYDYAKYSDNVQIFTEPAKTDNTLFHIHEYMKAAEQIIFLGFGFHNRNLDLLRPVEKMPMKDILGTILGQSPNSIEIVKSKLLRMIDGDQMVAKMRMDLSDMECKDFFDYHQRALP